KSMLLSRLRTTVVALCALTFLGAGFAAVSRVAADDPKRATEDSPAVGSHRASGLQPPPTPSKPAEPGGESWPLSLREAIGIGLKNSDAIRLLEVPAGEPAVDPLVIAPPRAGTDPQRFRSEAMALIRSIEQQYWNFAQAHVQLW